MDEGPIDMEGLALLFEQASPSDYVTTMFPDRPYNGQPHTDTGERGRLVVEGLTLRDLRDCFVRACFEASGLGREEWPGSLYDLPWSEMDPLAVFGNMSCEIERRMGVFPNVAVLGFECAFCGTVFICDAEKKYLCPHDHWREWSDHLWDAHPERMEGDGRTQPPP